MADMGIWEAYRAVRAISPAAADQIIWEAVTEALPEELTPIHVAVYRLMLQFPELRASEVLEIVGYCGITLHLEKERERND